MTLIDLHLGPRPDEPGPPISRGPQAYSAEVTARLASDAAQIMARYPESRSALLPLLHLVQAEDGYLTPAGITFCAGQLSLSPAEVTAVATFYSMYRRTPTGEYVVGVCTNTLCAVMGGDAILEVLEEHLGVHAGQTTPDGKVTLDHVECNAACDYAPVVMVNWEFFDNQTPESATQLVDDLRSGKAVQATRGATIGPWREAERVLAGFPDGLVDEGPAAGHASLVGLGIAREQGWTAPSSSPGLETGASAPSSTGDESEHAKSAAVEESSSSDEPAAEKDEAK